MGNANRSASLAGSIKMMDGQEVDPEESKTLTGGVKGDLDDEPVTKKELGSFRKIKALLGIELDSIQQNRLAEMDQIAADEADEEDEEDDFDYSAGGDVKQSLMWCCAGFALSNAVAVTLYFTGTPQSDGSTAIQNFYAGYLLELTLSLDNLFAFAMDSVPAVFGITDDYVVV